MAEVRIGTSGWSYSDWEGVFYKPGESKFQKYCRVFDTVEIDSTFYAYPDPELVEGLARSAPEGFLFSAKLPSLVTHEKRLDLNKGVEKDLGRFLDLMDPLRRAGKLGAYLIQLPPKFTIRNLKTLRRFLEILPGDALFAVEFRDPSLLRGETLDLLSRCGVAYTIVDEPLLPPEAHVTTEKLAYVRWHGRGERPWYYYHYDRRELEEWRPRLEELGRRVKRVYGYFNNHFKGYAVHNALQALEILGIITPSQRRVLETVEKALSEAKPAIQTLSELLPPEKIPDSVDGMLRLLTDGRRLARARKIGREVIEVEELSDERLVARVKDYRVVIDLEKRIILHDCADWSRVGARLSLCKHVAALMLAIEPSYAKRILREILERRGEWTFREV